MKLERYSAYSRIVGLVLVWSESIILIISQLYGCVAVLCLV